MIYDNSTLLSYSLAKSFTNKMLAIIISYKHYFIKSKPVLIYFGT